MNFDVDVIENLSGTLNLTRKKKLVKWSSLIDLRRLSNTKKNLKNK